MIHNFLYKQLGFKSLPGVANGFSQYEAKSCLQVARGHENPRLELLCIGAPLMLTHECTHTYMHESYYVLPKNYKSKSLQQTCR